MPEGKRILLTGATGFLGSHLCAALLEGGHHVVALSRPAANQSSRERVHSVVARAQAASGDGDIAAHQGLQNLDVIDGDIAEPGLGLEAGVYDRLATSLDEVWHCAASLSFLEEDREAIYRINLEGTRNVVSLASRTGGQRLHHISTAYVAGRRTGVVREDELDVGQAFKNPYEESKFEAELLIRSARQEGRVRATVFRPSIVIGDSRSGIATHFHGVYAFIRGLWTLSRRRNTERKQPGLRIRGSETSTLNFVPIDYVTEAIMSIAARESSLGRTFHIANAVPTPNKLWKGVVCDQLGLTDVELVGEESFRARPMDRIEAVFHRQMAFYHPYLESEPVFDCSDTEDEIRNTNIVCPEVTADFARKMTGWYIDRLNAHGARTLAAPEQSRL